MTSGVESVWGLDVLLEHPAIVGKRDKTKVKDISLLADFVNFQTPRMF